MRRRYYAHGQIRTLIGVFGALFNKLYVANFSKDGKSIDKLTHVPIIYLPRSRIYENEQTRDKNITKTDLEKFNRYYEVMPRMGFEFKGLTYNSEVQQAPSLNYRSGTQFGKVPTPYNLEFELNVLVRDQMTGLQIIEQIVPVFKPNAVVEVKNTAFEANIQDVNVVLNSITFEDTYKEMGETRYILYTLSFSVSTQFWPYVTGADIEIGKFVECGGKVDYPIDPNWPDDDDDDNGNDEALIDKIVIDYHHVEVYDKFWPTLYRETIHEFDGQIVSDTDNNPSGPIPEDPV
ncbi:tail sheath stabilizer [Rhizobium phage RL2RES]|uniref:Putative tail sheath stabilizer and completion protein n=1 Tax=Rhizobium phage RL2RES TaxID=103371 RepID=A0A6B9J1M5_9CAUD|nr:tail sheath stabilizer [Rhizobium phage RL2RES]QGZ14144.1 putative tail sheath stabilizer and completion protein [Rhizobium phage RL2RES]